MQTVSQEWKDNQNQRLVSESFVEISLNISNPDAITDATLSPRMDGSALNFSTPEQVIDGSDRDITTYATLEQNLWLLDGSRKIIPNNDYESCGYISTHMSVEAGVFNLEPLVSIQFPTVQEDEIPGITITWSETLGEYPRHFYINAYNGDTLIATKEVTDNTDVRSLVLLNISGYDRIDVRVVKWCLPFRRARMENILTGISVLYTKNDLFSFSHSQEIDPISASLPQSGVSFSVDNTKNTYNPDNADGLSRYLTEKQEVNVKYGYKIGDKTEWIKCGTFYLSDWKSKENSNKAEFSATDILENLQMIYDEIVYYDGGVSLYDLAEDVLIFAGIPLQSDGSNRWLLDESLKDIITTAYLPRDTVVNCLQFIANAGGCVLYVDRNGVIRIEKRNIENSGYIISPDNSFSKPEKTLSNPIKQIVVTVYNYEVADEETMLTMYFVPRGTPLNQPIDITVSYDTAVDVRLNGITDYSMTINSLEIFTTHCNVNFTRTMGLDSYFWVYGRPVKITKSQIVIPISDVGEEITIDNPLITDFTVANAVGEWVKDYVTERQSLSFTWRADPRLDAGDIIKCQGAYNTNNVIVTKVEYTYNGAFRGSGEGRVV